MPLQNINASGKLDHSALDSLIFSDALPFGIQANRSGRFNYTSDVALRERDFERIARLCERFDIRSIDELRSCFEKATRWSGSYFEALAVRSGYYRWDSDRTMLYLLVLVANFANRISVADLIDLGWEESFAKKVLGIAQSITPISWLH